MRNERIRKLRNKNRPLEIMIKLVLICYVVIFSVSYLTSGTSAFFGSSKQLEPEITAGYWDKSSLAFLSQENQHIKTCPAKIEAELKNEGDGEMLDDTTYEVYYVEKGNAERDGEKLTLEKDEDIVKALESEEKIKLTYETNKSGVYAFVAYQHEENPGDYEVWSELIEVDCSIEKSSKGEGKEPSTTKNKVIEQPKEEAIKEEKKEILNEKQEETVTNDEMNNSESKKKEQTLGENSSIPADKEAIEYLEEEDEELEDS